MTAAYILMQLNTPDPRKVMKSIRAVAGVKQAHLLAGPTDCIAYVEAADHEALSTTVIALRSVKGVASTDTRIAVSLA
ncbi:MAG TPA: Lrp/AsnC ligand binding domain-containing protein [Anaerolineales bacterium]|nr:Lrp/AsnC ligand binding domain-containing protein [Anaerolineales bacterium]